MQSRCLRKLASRNSELPLLEDRRLERFIVALNDWVTDRHRDKVGEIYFFALLLLAVLILVVTAVGSLSIVIICFFSCGTLADKLACIR